MKEVLKPKQLENITPEMLAAAGSFLTEHEKDFIRQLLKFNPYKIDWVGSHQVGIERFFMIVATGRVLPSPAEHTGLLKTWGVERSFAFLPNYEFILAYKPELMANIDPVVFEHVDIWSQEHFHPNIYGRSASFEDFLAAKLVKNDVPSVDGDCFHDNNPVLLQRLKGRLREYLLKEATSQGINVEELLREAFSRRGVVFYLSPKIFEYDVRESNENPGEELVVVGQDGFPVECLVGVRALGEEEQRIFRQVAGFS